MDVSSSATVFSVMKGANRDMFNQAESRPKRQKLMKAFLKKLSPESFTPC